MDCTAACAVASSSAATCRLKQGGGTGGFLAARSSTRGSGRAPSGPAAYPWKAELPRAFTCALRRRGVRGRALLRAPF